MKTMTAEIAALQQAVSRCKGQTNGQYDDLLFEFGCRFVESNIDDRNLSAEILAERRFWKWWNVQYRLHDKQIRQTSDYRQQKKIWLQSPLMLMQFINLLAE